MKSKKDLELHHRYHALTNVMENKAETSQNHDGRQEGYQKVVEAWNSMKVKINGTKASTRIYQAKTQFQGKNYSNPTKWLLQNML